jgi:hypothetical protein
MVIEYEVLAAVRINRLHLQGRKDKREEQTILIKDRINETYDVLWTCSSNGRSPTLGLGLVGCRSSGRAPRVSERDITELKRKRCMSEEVNCERWNLAEGSS